MTRDDGGPAFPKPATHVKPDNDRAYVIPAHNGMTRRDWIAGQALAGMLAHATRYKPRPGASSNWHEAISEEAYQLADAMIAAGKAEGSTS